MSATATHTESSFTRWFCECIKKANGYCVPIVGAKMQRTGLPDRYICHRRFRGWCEFKKDDRHLAKIQRTVLDCLQDRGDTCLVVRYHRSQNVSVETIDRRTLIQLDLRELHGLSDGKCGVRFIDLLQDARNRLIN
jgi:hypothetical protein